ncbi:uncharacterized protein MYCFIDRAFT_88096 [Pseudocercospora fijiensis CIRAD86]|uniref:DUF1917-domain-containing protein n=1 Tax=Pseudocercospora fijiensis (strain CIRAD86) TaxID=383855 RepID=M3AVQ0_PSEFD|nr:uncharacterized protein MYCFIDRAFT_88096 [Pseudocercospora fijiensis CIRAD86]EME81552.1 hypothetical protein MYCFIDRAFT_88096 [Pseudocercospora fijiensis CIRAD86]
MADDRLVDGAGWISDESDFYGDENVRGQLERECGRGTKRCHKAFMAQHSPKKVKTPRSPSENGTLEVKARPTQNQPVHGKADAGHDVVSFLKSRPQLSALQKSHDDGLKPKCREPARTVAGETQPDLVSVDRFKGHPCAWQQTETIDAFLKRLPVGDPNTSTLDGWLWVGSPEQPYAHVNSRKHYDLLAFEERAESLLEKYLTQQAAIEDEMSGKSQAAITRRMGPYRDQLECDILGLAVEMGVTCGKWMLFPGAADLPRYWRLVATATCRGKLGPTAKSAVFDPQDPETVICIYTYDFTDSEDVRRVLEELVDIGVCSNEGRRIYYKCDAYTHLGIKSQNLYKLRASLYSSSDILQDKVKALTEGPVARLKKSKKTRKMDDFFSAFSDDLV